MVRFLIHFAQAHPEFRLPELQSIAELHGFRISEPLNPNGSLESDWDPQRPFWVVDLEREEHAKALAERCILVKSVHQLYAHGKSYEEVHEKARPCSHLWSRYKENMSFRFNVNAYNHRIPLNRQREIVESFNFMDIQGKIDLKNPDVTFTCYEEYPDRKTCERDREEGGINFLHVFFGRLIAEGKARPLILKYNVKKRAYYGNTSMESEISLLMANQTLASPGKFVYDPFLGTGSMAYTAAQFGAFVFGSDIDGRQMRGKGDTPGVMISAKQYGLASRVIDLCTFDVTQSPLRCGELFDAIVTDPPYGVRAGAKRLGRKESDHRARDPETERLQSTGQIDYVPPTKPYELSDLARDLVLRARYLLKPGGRLVFFLPTVTDEYKEVDITTMLCDGMEVVANSLQDFGSWGRRLITIKKTTSEKFHPPFSRNQGCGEVHADTHIPAHKDFREKYFRKFRKDEKPLEISDDS